MLKQRVFITATDTGVGKTYITTILIKLLSLKISIEEILISKPVSSGSEKIRGCLLSIDALKILQAIYAAHKKNNDINFIRKYNELQIFLTTDSNFKKQLKQLSIQDWRLVLSDLKNISLINLAPALSPPIAMLKSNKIYMANEILQWLESKEIQQPTSKVPLKLHIIEGAGGFYSPICFTDNYNLNSNKCNENPFYFNSDLAFDMHMQLVLVIQDKIGSINSFLLSYNAIQKLELKIKLIVLNCYTENDKFGNYYSLQKILARDDLQKLVRIAEQKTILQNVISESDKEIILREFLNK